jgi:hypothetical protein
MLSIYQAPVVKTPVHRAQCKPQAFLGKLFGGVKTSMGSKVEQREARKAEVHWGLSLFLDSKVKSVSVQRQPSAKPISLPGPRATSSDSPA